MVSRRAICVYAGSTIGGDDRYRRAAVLLAEAIAERNLSLIYGGASIGLMGELADRALELGVPVTGIIPQAPVDLEGAHDALTDLRIVTSMHERKQLMADLASAFVALPGGVGTLEELIETYSWLGLGMHSKPVGLLDVADFWAGLKHQIDHALAEGFIRQAQRALLLHDADAGRLLDRMS